MSSLRRGTLLYPCLLLIGSLIYRYASGAPADGDSNLYQVSLQDLMDMEVTSASKKTQTLAQAPAAIFVIGQEDIARSGALNIPDLLRMVPGLDVAQINASTWAISARGFNTQFADKLLVLVDGRTVYTPTQDGVNWDTLDVVLEDIERIEIIRGPGTTVWGENAVNGVINVITKRAKDTQGTWITAGGGTATQGFGTLQYGGELPGNFNYRVFAKYADIGSLPDISGLYAADGWNLLHGGFRLDGPLSATESMTAQGDVYSGREGAVIQHIVSIFPPVNDVESRVSDLSGGNTLLRWDHSPSNGATAALQFYFDRYLRSGPESNEARNTVDVDFHEQARIDAHQEIVWGADYRHTADQITGTIDQGYLATRLAIPLYSAFIQDQVTWDRTSVYAGAKWEHTNFAPFVAEPSLRWAFNPEPSETWWAAVSQAARTPARRDIDANINLGVSQLPNGQSAVPTLFGNPEERPEKLLSFELGYRAQLSRFVSVDIATFVDRYRDLRSTEQGTPYVVETPSLYGVATPMRYVELPLTYANLVQGITDGVEGSVRVEVTDRWTLSPGFTYLRMNLRTNPDSRDTSTVANTEGSSPRYQAQLRSAYNLTGRIQWNWSVGYVSQLPAQQIASYTRLDTNITWQPVPALEICVVGQNLLHAWHLESNDVFTSVNSSQIERSGYVRIAWHF